MRTLDKLPDSIRRDGRNVPLMITVAGYKTKTQRIWRVMYALTGVGHYLKVEDESLEKAAKKMLKKLVE